MSHPELKSLDDYQQFVSHTIKPWSRERRIALAAAMAERWLPVYESFSEEEDWGDPSILKRAVEAVWNCALGKELTPKDHVLLKNRVEENTPHVDDFAVDLEEVIATSSAIHYALNCCMSDDNTEAVVWAMVSGFEGIAPGISTDGDEVSGDLLESSQFSDFLKDEVKPLVDNLPAADEQEVEILRQELMSTPAVWHGGEGPLPPEVWESPLVNEEIEKNVKLRKGLPDIFRVIAQKIQTLRQDFETPETKKAAEQTAQNVWQLPQVQDELKKQLELLELVGHMAQVERQEVKALRQKLTSKEIAGTVAPRPDPRMTNEAVFQRYRGYIEIDLKHRLERENNKELMNVMAAYGTFKSLYFSEWASRYSRRNFVLDGCPMLDVVARNALLERYSKKDAAVQGDPGWDEETRSSFELSYQYLPRVDGGIEVRTPYEPHSYGPSFRQLCIERRLAGDSDQDIWNGVGQWARHRPAAWEDEDRRKEQKLAYATPELEQRLTRELSWCKTNDVDYPWATEVASETWRIGLNDFPDDFMYTLVIDEKVIGKFHDWPNCWHR